MTSETAEIIKPGRREMQVAATKEKLCRATLETISEIGYHASTTTLIAKRAGVSRGAQTHHYPSKMELVTAAFSFLVNQWEVKRAAHLKASGTSFTIEGYLDFLWDEVFNDPYYVAALEMLLAAKGDEKLEGALTAELEKFSDVRVSIWRSLLCNSLPVDQADTLMHMTTCLFRGMSMQSALDADSERANARIIELLKAFIASQIKSSFDSLQ